LKCGGIFSDKFIARLLLSFDGDRILKIGQHLAKLWATVGCPVFLLTGYILTPLLEAEESSLVTIAVIASLLDV